MSVELLNMDCMKTCTKCLTNKPITEFGKHAAERDGLQPYCKPCLKIVGDAWRAANPDKVKARSAAYHVENREKIKARKAAWHAANKEKLTAKHADYRAANREQIKTSNAAYQAANPEARRIYSHNRRARESGGRLSKGLAEKLFKAQKGKCACCGLPLGDDYHLDHIMPLALGGTNTDDNIQLLRQQCNNQKSSKHPIAFMQSRGFLL